MPANTARRVGRAQTDRPEAPVLAQSEHGVGAVPVDVQLGRPSPEGCPCRSAGPARGRRRRHAPRTPPPAGRSGRPAGCGTTSNPSPQRLGLALPGQHPARGPAGPDGARVSAIAHAASAAASVGGERAPAAASSPGRARAPWPARSRSPSGPVGIGASSVDRRAHVADGPPDAERRAGHLGAAAARQVVDRDLARSARRRRRPGRPSRPDSRTAGRVSPSPSRSSRRAARIGPMSCSRSPVRRRIRRRQRPVGHPELPRERHRGPVAARPSTRSAVARRAPGPTTRASWRGSRLASASITATTGAVAASRPAWQAAP